MHFCVGTRLHGRVELASPLDMAMWTISRLARTPQPYGAGRNPEATGLGASLSAAGRAAGTGAVTA